MSNIEKQLCKEGTDKVLGQTSDDEIDLVQLFLILRKRKALIVTVTLICLLAGVGYALLKKTIYKYTTTIQVGTALVGGGDSFKKAEIEAIPTVKLKLENVYFPMALEQIRSKYEGHVPSASVKENKNSNILFVISKGLSENSQIIKDLHATAVSPLIANHRDVIAASKKQYEILVQRAQLSLKDLENPKLFTMAENEIKVKIESVQLDLAGIDEEKKILQASKVGLKETKVLLQQQIGKIEKNLIVSYAKRDKVISGIKDEAKAMTFLMLNSDIQHNENRLAVLRERLNVNLENESQKIEGQLAEILRRRKLLLTKVDVLKSQLVQLQAQRSSDQEKQRSEIAEAENKIKLYQDTKVLDLAVRSIKPISAGKLLIVVLSGVLGLMIGVVAAFFAEFMVTVRQQQAEE